MRRGIRLILAGLLFVPLLSATPWAYAYNGYPGDRGYQPEPGSVRGYQRPGSLRIQKGMTEEGYYVHVYLQGLQPEDIQVFVRHNRLILQSLQEDEYGQLGPVSHSVSRWHRRFRKQLRLPYDADGSRMTRTTKDGVLEIYIPRVSPPLPSAPVPQQ